MVSSSRDFLGFLPGGGLILPVLLIAGGAATLWYFTLGPGKQQLSNIGASIGNGVGGIGNTIHNNFNSGVNKTAGNLTWIQDYSGYILAAGIILWLIIRVMPKPKGLGGLIMQLFPWILILGGGIIFMTNFTAGGVPNIGAAIKNVLHPSGSHYAALPPMGGKSYIPVQRRIITGTHQTTQTNPSYDRNTVFPVVGDVY